MKYFEANKKTAGAYVHETFLRYRAPESKLGKRLKKKGLDKETLVSSL
jgi:hypothetical protein